MDATTVGWLVLVVLVCSHWWCRSQPVPRQALGTQTAYRFVTGLQGGSGSTIGPGRALYVTEGTARRITRVDPKTEATTTYASGMPKSSPASAGRSTSRPSAYRDFCGDWGHPERI